MLSDGKTRLGLFESGEYPCMEPGAGRRAGIESIGVHILDEFSGFAETGVNL
jgi:hypothetical protein